MRAIGDKTANNKTIGYLRLAMVSATTAVLIALGLTVAHFNMPAAGQTCSVRNATTDDSARRTMWCHPASAGSRSLVWQYAPAA